VAAKKKPTKLAAAIERARSELSPDEQDGLARGIAASLDQRRHRLEPHHVPLPEPQRKAGIVATWARLGASEDGPMRAVLDRMYAAGQGSLYPLLRAAFATVKEWVGPSEEAGTPARSGRQDEDAWRGLLVSLEVYDLAFGQLAAASLRELVVPTHNRGRVKGYDDLFATIVVRAGAFGWRPGADVRKVIEQLRESRKPKNRQP
jgi:hypothetical protein